MMEHEIAPGHVLGRYELLLPIAAGGMAMVWAARLKGTRGFQKIVAIKTMLPKLTEDDQFEKMFLDEARLASQIRHPHVVEILDLGDQDGVLFLAMAWIDGVPLNQLMKTAKVKGGVPAPLAVRIVMQAASGIHAAHELTDENGTLVGLVHRDISPQNILVTYDGVAKVVDFGVAKATALGEGATQAGQLKGKVSYMAPEQVRGERIDRRVDVFAMGIVLYALTTGKHPFRKESEGATLFAITAADPVVPPRKFMPDYPLALQEVLLKALEKDRNQRYATASDLAKALDKVLPPDKRAADEDVAVFVRALFEQQRLASREKLAIALERADRRATGAEGSGIKDANGSVVKVAASAASKTGSLSVVGVAASLVPGGANVSSTGLSSAVAPTEARRLRAWGIGALVLAGLTAITLLILRAASSAESANVAGVPLASATALPVASFAPVQPLPSAEPSAAASASVKAHVATKAPRRHPTAAKNSAPLGATPNGAPPASTAAKAPTWKHDPGF